jgi:hypothetical protein
VWLVSLAKEEANQWLLHADRRSSPGHGVDIDHSCAFGDRLCEGDPTPSELVTEHGDSGGRHDCLIALVAGSNDVPTGNGHREAVAICARPHVSKGGSER